MGVIVARFQTPYLTPGHRELIETVRARHRKFAIVLGIARVVPSRSNPLDHITRYKMIQDAYPGTLVYGIPDNRSDKLWSENLDMILRMYHPHEKIVLYGGRDSFVPHYSGKFPAVELDSALSESGTQLRMEAFHEVRETEDFRRGVCYATANQYSKKVVCVDAAVIDVGKAFRVLLAQKKEDGEKWRFIGGHMDQKTAEAAVRKEVSEEAGCSVDDVKYIGSAIIDDWRYRGNVDSIFTLFYEAKYVFGPVRAGDDVDRVQWFHWTDLTEDMFVDEHKVLFRMYRDHLLSRFPND